MAQICTVAFYWPIHGSYFVANKLSTTRLNRSVATSARKFSLVKTSCQCLGDVSQLPAFFGDFS